jgi:hypothetical protein
MGKINVITEGKVLGRQLVGRTYSVGVTCIVELTFRKVVKALLPVNIKGQRGKIGGG